MPSPSSGSFDRMTLLTSPTPRLLMAASWEGEEKAEQDEEGRMIKI